MNTPLVCIGGRDRDIHQLFDIRLWQVERECGTCRKSVAYWTLRPDLHRRISAPDYPERDRRIDWEAAKTRVLSVLKRHAERVGLEVQNTEVRRITHFDRQQVNRLIHELEEEG